MRIEKNLTLDAIPARVYNALTHVNEITQWFCDLAHFDLKKDAHVEFAWKKTGKETLHHKALKCQIEDYVHCKELDMACEYGPEKSEIQISLRPRGLTTELTVTHDGIEDPDRACKTDYYWDENLKRLKKYIEERH